MSTDIASLSCFCYPPHMAGQKSGSSKAGSWVIRGIPRETMHKTRIAAAVERKSIKRFLLDVVEAHLDELERKGMVPKGKG